MAGGGRADLRVLLPVYLLLDVSWDAAGYRGADIEPGLAAYAFDVGNLGFANVWVAMGSFAVAAGWVVLAPGCSGAGWAGGRWSPASGWCWPGSSGPAEVWLVPYFLFWIWVVVVSVQLIRGRVRWGGRP